MALPLSRRRIARWVAASAEGGTVPAESIRRAAAYLMQTGRTREYELLARDIEDALVSQGIVVADVTTATGLTSTLRGLLDALIDKGAKLELREHIDPDIIGGIRVELPGRRFDSTIQHKLETLRKVA